MLSADIYNKVKAVFDGYGIPENIWNPIAATESSFNPNDIASTPSEYSVGLFQINMMAHPEYSKSELLDPVRNSEIAAKYFIAPAYEKYKSISEPMEQATMIYKNGILPQWTDGTKSRFQNNFISFANGTSNEDLGKVPSNKQFKIPVDSFKKRWGKIITDIYGYDCYDNTNDLYVEKKFETLPKEDRDRIQKEMDKGDYSEYNKLGDEWVGSINTNDSFTGIGGIENKIIRTVIIGGVIVIGIIAMFKLLNLNFMDYVPAPIKAIPTQVKSSIGKVKNNGRN